METWK